LTIFSCSPNTETSTWKPAKGDEFFKGKFTTSVTSILQQFSSHELLAKKMSVHYL